MGFLKKKLLTVGLLGISAAGCVSIFHAIGRDFSAESGIAGQAGENSYDASSEIKVITYNLAHCRGSYDFYGNNARMDETERMEDLDMNLTIDSAEQVYRCLDDVAEMLMKEDADIALLQEVDKKAVWSYDIDFTPYLAEKSGMGYYAYGPRYDFVWWPFERQRANREWIDTVYFDIGNAVLSRYPILSAENKAFDSQGLIDWIAGEERYLDTVINIRGEDVRVISAHFGRGEMEARKIIEETKASSMPLIFGGTLHILLPAARETCKWCNEEYVNGMQEAIDSGLFNIYMTRVNALDSKYFTADTGNLYWTPDYIIPTKDIEILDYYVVDARLSDHMPVAAVLSFQ